MRAMLLGAVAALTLLSACSTATSGDSTTHSDAASQAISTQDATTVTPTTGPSGNAICDAAALGAAMQTARSDGAELVQLVNVTCDGDWAIAIAVSRVTSTTTVQSVVVFQRTPEGWTEQDREGSCSAGVIPESLRAAACEAP